MPLPKLNFLLVIVKENFNSLVNLATEVEVLASEFQKSKASVETISLVMDEGLQDFAFFSPLMRVSVVCVVWYILLHRLFLWGYKLCLVQHTSIMAGSKNRQSCYFMSKFLTAGFHIVYAPKF